MLKPLTKQQTKRIDDLMRRMSIEQMVGQTLSPLAWSFNQNPKGQELTECIDRVKRWVDDYHVGCLFFPYGTRTNLSRMEREVQAHSGIPVIVNGDMETGAGYKIKGNAMFPNKMLAAAANSVALVRTMAEATSAESRPYGAHWAFSPMVDLCYSPRNSMVFSRTFSSSPVQTARLARAFIQAMQKDGRCAATAKHFPGDGFDERDPHMSTAVLALSRNEWMETYGFVWKACIDAGVMAIMTGHIALPFVDPPDTWMGPRPASLSRKIQLDFLRGELGFDGTLVSDATTMIGFSGHLPPDERAWQCIENGSDVFLFSEPDRDFPQMMKALKARKLSEARVAFAARKVLELKTRVGLMDGKQFKLPTAEVRAGYRKAAVAIAERGLKVVRDEYNVLPLKLKKGSRVLTITCTFVEGVRHGTAMELPVVDKELRKRGIKVDHLFNPWAPDFIPDLHKYDAVFYNLNIPPRYGANRLQPPISNPLWEGSWWHHPRPVFTSFGNPYMIAEIPCAPNMVLTFCNSELAQAAAVRLWLGEIKPRGKNPVALDGFFECEI